MYEYLGGKCVICGSSESLIVHHKDPDEKEHNINNILYYEWSYLVKELTSYFLIIGNMFLKFIRLVTAINLIMNH